MAKSFADLMSDAEIREAIDQLVKQARWTVDHQLAPALEKYAQTRQIDIDDDLRTYFATADTIRAMFETK